MKQNKILVIVESPNKIKKIEQYLGKEYIVLASVGHIRDLRKSGETKLGIHFEPEFHLSYAEDSKKASVIAKIRSEAKKAEKILIATDPDREGEAIGWHIFELIKDLKEEMPPIMRVSFNQITEDAVIEAVNNPRELDMDLVHSQEARRAVDRIVGFRLSKLVKEKIKAAKSAGRVQSATLKLISDREKEKEDFIPVHTWTIEILPSLKDDKYTIKLLNDKGNEWIFNSVEEANNLLKKIDNKFKVVDISSKEKKIGRVMPLEMSSLLSSLYSNLGMSNKQASFSAQKLYERGYITYPRTDSTRILSKEFISSSKKLISDKWGKEYFQMPLLGKKKKNRNEQEAHEAIRPSSILNTPEELSTKLDKKMLAVYTYIYNRTLKAMMVCGVNEIKSYFIENEGFKFRFSDSKPIKLGYRVVDFSESKTETPLTKYLSLKVGDELSFEKKNIMVCEHATSPPARFNPSSLIKMMKEKGIGRPSTYASTTSTLFARFYIEQNKNQLVPTELGILVVDRLKENFSDILDDKYTLMVEEKLNDIASGIVNYEPFVIEFYNVFQVRVEEAMANMDESIIAPQTTGNNCPECELPLVERRGRFGKFEGCSGFPQCRYIKNDPVYTGGKCPECEGRLVEKKSKYRTKFEGCENYPKCTYIKKNPKVTSKKKKVAKK